MVPVHHGLGSEHDGGGPVLPHQDEWWIPRRRWRREVHTHLPCIRSPLGGIGPLCMEGEDGRWSEEKPGSALGRLVFLGVVGPLPDGVDEGWHGAIIIRDGIGIDGRAPVADSAGWRGTIAGIRQMCLGWTGETVEEQGQEWESSCHTRRFRGGSFLPAAPPPPPLSL